MTNPLYDALFRPHEDREAPFLLLPVGREMSYREFLRGASRFSHVLSSANVVQGDRVAVQVEKSPEALMLYAACLMTGAIFLPLNTAYTDTELDYFIEDSGAALIVLDPARAARDGSLTLSAAGGGSLAEAAQTMDDHFDPVARAEDDVASLVYTSGTTGRSKGAMLTHGNLLSNALTLKDLWQFTERDTLLHALPIFHVHGLYVATNVLLAAGGSMIFLPKFDLTDIIRHLPRATTMMGLPTFYTRLLGNPGFTRELTDHMRLFISGSAPLLADTHTEFEARTGHRILERYGMTETGMNTSNPFNGPRRPGTVGLPLPGVDLRITEDGVPLPKGEVGLVEVRGPNVFKGYWNMPEKTAEDMREDGFFITGDMGKLHEDGYLEIVGRSKDLIISGGYNIYPKEVEALLDEQPGVLESAVIGVPHDDFGETPVGLIVANQGSEPDLGAVEAAVRTALARFKHPKRLILVEELPRNTMGKVQKNLLRDAYKDLFL